MYEHMFLMPVGKTNRFSERRDGMLCWLLDSDESWDDLTSIQQGGYYSNTHVPFELNQQRRTNKHYTASTTLLICPFHGDSDVPGES